nr:MAG TPA: hypothetical protein [Caudoviricetes sp.]
MNDKKERWFSDHRFFNLLPIPLILYSLSLYIIQLNYIYLYIRVYIGV